MTGSHERHGSDMADEPVGIGLIGAGGTFGAFILTALRDVPRARLTAIADINERALAEGRQTLGVEHAYTDYRRLIADDRVQLIIVASPPFTQHEIGTAVLESGKALFLEKPGSVTLGDMRRLVDLQRARRVPATVDYVMRWNELLDVVRTIRRSNALGRLQSVQFVNYAQDETLPKGHWFWDRSKSGGIWIEHCVHFFDLYGELVGTPPMAVASAQSVRDDTAPAGQVDQVDGAVCHEQGIICGYFHAFNRPKPMERQQAIVAFDRGFVTIHGWIADAVELDGWVDTAAARLLQALPHIIDSQEHVVDQELRRGDSSWHADSRVTLRFGLTWDRNESYRREVAAGLNDLLDARADTQHIQRVTLTDALRSLAVACAVTGTATLEEMRTVYDDYRPSGR